ncbi:hypothetical protein JKP88DRAFT_254848 [Tribonema minus]|uniref:Uncharacterized protein n=1 Tax=Tribonema minus TaxID=303371 RepID=A0A835Z5Y0_9STRA|nr:hypothetical protein JKP88DRAFT_254848 [Tribonema minus]
MLQLQVHKGYAGRRAARKASRALVARRKAQAVAAQADHAAATGAHDEAAALVEAALALDAACAAALLLRSRLLYARADYARALSDAVHALAAAAPPPPPAASAAAPSPAAPAARAPTAAAAAAAVAADMEADAAWACARCHARLEDWEGAADVLARYLRARPRDARAQALRGHACLRLRDGGGALYHFSRALELKGNKAAQRDLIRLGAARCCDQDWAAAETDLTAATRLKPSSAAATVDALAARGHLYACMREFPSAARDFKEALRLIPASPAAAAGLAQVTAPVPPVAVGGSKAKAAGGQGGAVRAADMRRGGGLSPLRGAVSPPPPRGVT